MSEKAPFLSTRPLADKTVSQRLNFVRYYAPHLVASLAGIRKRSLAGADRDVTALHKNHGRGYFWLTGSQLVGKERR